MIYTLTLNPSLDYTIVLDNFHIGKVNRTAEENLYPGGKGINVSIVLKRLGVESVALGFLAGFTGDEIERLAKEAGCSTDFIRLKDGYSRINVKIRMGKESEINARGPEITGEDMDALSGRLDGLAPEDFLVLAGSIPAGLPSDSYERILRRLKEKKVKAVVDAEKDLLVNALKYRPFLIKPNRDELGAIFGVKLKSGDEIIHYAKRLQKMGAENVLVSMAGDGAILAASDGRILRALPPSGKVVNSVGSGDSMVAGFLAGYLHTGDFENALKVGICAGSATAFSEWLAPPDRIEKLLKIM